MLKQDTISWFIVQRALGALDSLWHISQSGAWGFLVLRLFSGSDVLFPVLWKRRSNNGWYSMTMRFRRHRAERNPRMASHDVRFPL
jgi:hypothetical protein